MFYENNMKLHTKLWFTFVELMVIVSVLAILWTVGFISFWKYLTNARDSARVAQLSEISDGLKILSLEKTLPKPDEAITINYWPDAVFYQWKTWNDLQEYTEFTNKMIDPKSGLEYTYIRNKRGNHFQIAAFLEGREAVWERVELLDDATAASNYIGKYPYLVWKNLGLIVWSGSYNHVPIEQVEAYQAKKNIDLLTETDSFKIYLGNTDVIEWIWSELSEYNPRANCKRIQESTGTNKSGEFSIDPEGDWTFNSVYCDMETDGWGWTVTTMLADTTTGNLFSETHVNSSNFIKSVKKNITTQGKLSNVWKNNSNKDILLQCFSADNELAWYKIPFIIYDFPGAEKWNLTQDDKAGKEFSSLNLIALWSGHKIRLHKNYKNNESELIDVSNKLVFWLEYDKIFVNPNSAINPNSPAYNAAWKASSFSVNNYCISAIR